MKKTTITLIGMFFIFGLISCSKGADTQISSYPTDSTSIDKSPTPVLPESVMTPQEIAELQGLSGELQNINAKLETAHNSQTLGSGAIMKSLLEQKQEILNTFQNKILTERREQQLSNKEYVKLEDVLLAEFGENGRKLEQNRREEMAKVVTSMQKLENERNILIKKLTSISIPNSPESKQIENINVELKKLEDEKLIISSEFMTKNATLQSEGQAKMLKLQKDRDEKLNAFNERVKTIEMFQNSSF